MYQVISADQANGIGSQNPCIVLNKYYSKIMQTMSKFPPLNKYAITEDNSEGRLNTEEFDAADLRCAFMHDRDRIIHSRAFRRLEAKTQVVLIHESDHSRTRLTHSLEVNQISESIALSLGLNAYATSAIALGHDVGHTPFGHTGERALSTILSDFGLRPFKHNYQGVLVVNKLEKRYSKSDGLNLMQETRDGILKHSSLNKEIDLKFYDSKLNDTVDWPITLEGQIVSLVDEIAQRTHDTDDALRTNRIAIEDLVKQNVIINAINIANLNANSLIEEYKINKSLVISTIIISLIKFYVYKTIEHTKKLIDRLEIRTIDDVRKSQFLIVDWDENFKKADKQFTKEFLRPRFYEHHEIKRMDSRAEYFLKQTFKAFLKHTKQLPESTHKEFINAVDKYLRDLLETNIEGNFKNDIEKYIKLYPLPCNQSCCYVPKSKYPNEEQITNSLCPLFKHSKPACSGIRVIVNHIAGMTDRYAHLEYSRLYFPPEISRL